MVLKIFEIINLVLAAIVGGMYWGPWLALTISIKKFSPLVFLSVANRLNKNMAPLMTILTPFSILAAVPVLIILFKSDYISSFCFTLIGLIFFVIALVTTVVIEVPIVKQIITWTEATLPDNWEALRDKWGKFHIVRVSAGILGFIFFLLGAIL